MGKMGKMGKMGVVNMNMLCVLHTTTFSIYSIVTNSLGYPPELERPLYPAAEPRQKPKNTCNQIQHEHFYAVRINKYEIFNIISKEHTF